MLFNETLEEKRFIVASKQMNKRISDPCNAKKHYQSSIRKKPTKSVKQ